MTTSPAAILYDASANPVGVVLDGVVYRLQVEATIAGSLPLPTGAATESTLASLDAKAATETTLQTLATEATAQTLLTQSEFQARVGTLGQKSMAGSTPVVLAADQSRVLVEALVANADGLSASVVKRGTNAFLAVDNQGMSTLLEQMLEQLVAIRKHLDLINEDSDPL